MKINPYPGSNQNQNRTYAVTVSSGGHNASVQMKTPVDTVALSMLRPVHGRVPFNTNKAQAEIQRLIDAGEASEDIGGVVVGLEPAVNPVPEKVDIPEKVDTPENEKEKGGILFIVIGVLIGVGSWLLKKTTR